MRTAETVTELYVATASDIGRTEGRMVFTTCATNGHFPVSSRYFSLPIRLIRRLPHLLLCWCCHLVKMLNIDVSSGVTGNRVAPDGQN